MISNDWITPFAVAPFTFTDASINNNVSNPIEILIQSALEIDMSNNIGENLSQYIGKTASWWVE